MKMTLSTTALRAVQGANINRKLQSRIFILSSENLQQKRFKHHGKGRNEAEVSKILSYEKEEVNSKVTSSPSSSPHLFKNPVINGRSSISTASTPTSVHHLSQNSPFYHCHNANSEDFCLNGDTRNTTTDTNTTTHEFSPNGFTNDHQHRNHQNRHQHLPILDASPLLDPKSFCTQRSASAAGGTGGVTTVSGGDAAKRLVRARKEVVQLVRGALLQSNLGFSNSRGEDRGLGSGNGEDVNGGKGKAFGLCGHGVPVQLLRDHLDAALMIFERVGIDESAHPGSAGGRAVKCSFNNFNGNLCFDWMRIKSKDGKNRAFPWPKRLADDATRNPEKDLWYDLDHRMNLYLHVMARMANTFGGLLDLNNRDDAYADANADDTTTKHVGRDVNENDLEDDSVPPIVLQNGTLFQSCRPKHWNVELIRGFVYPPSYIYADGLGNGGDNRNWSKNNSNKKHSYGSLSPPIIELTKGRGINSTSPSHVRITLQGSPRADKLEPVSIIFDAFYNRAEMELMGY